MISWENTNNNFKTLDIMGNNVTKNLDKIYNKVAQITSIKKLC